MEWSQVQEGNDDGNCKNLRPQLSSDTTKHFLLLSAGMQLPIRQKCQEIFQEGIWLLEAKSAIRVLVRHKQSITLAYFFLSEEK